MFIETARRLADILQEISDERVLDVGSSDRKYRTVSQPWIEGLVMGPLRARGCKIFHFDEKDGEGVDIVGDVTHMGNIGKFDLVLCLSLLEHVTAPSMVVNEIYRVLTDGGWAVFEVPADYPIHEDPIDTGLRMKTREQWDDLLGPMWTIHHFEEIEAPSRKGSCTMVAAQKDGVPF